MTTWRFRSKDRFYGLIAAAILAVSYAFYLGQRPSYDWDMLAYMAVALSDAGAPADTVHEKTYSIVRASLPPDQVRYLTEGGISPGENVPEYRKKVANDPVAFAAQLPFYSVKPTYPALMSVLYSLGVNLVTSGILISATAYVGLCLLLYLWFSQWLKPIVSVPLMGLVALSPYVTFLSRGIGPDGLSTFVVLLAIYLCLEQERILPGIIVFIISIGVRPENVFYAEIFFIYLVVFGKLKPVNFAVSSVAAASLFFGLRFYNYNYSWGMLFYHTFVHRITDPHDVTSAVGFWDYVRAYVGQLDRVLIGKGEFPVFVLIGFGAYCLKANSRLRDDKYLHLIFLAAIFIVIRMMILPVEAFRALLPSYMMLTVALVQSCADLEARARQRVNDREGVSAL